MTRALNLRNNLNLEYKISLWVKLTLIFTLALFIPSVYKIYFKAKETECQMTYMFQYPEYIRIHLSRKVQSDFPFYRLYAYGEGGYAHQLEQGKFTGQPVIFVPGNAGSYEQVRSFASVAHRMFEDGLKDVRLDFFTLHLNEEKSGVFGQVLPTQVQFLAHCITRIQELYASNGQRNVSCILIGHSIGGIIARALMLEPWFDASCVQLLITLAAPHRRPVIAMDQYMSYYYSWINSEWAKERRGHSATTGISRGKLSHLHHISIAGGSNDLVVPTQSTLLPHFLSCAPGALNNEKAEKGKVNTSMLINHPLEKWFLMNSIPGVWLTTDHLNIVWCRQFVKKIIRLLHDFTYISSPDVRVSRKKSTLADSHWKDELFLLSRQKDVIHYHLKSGNRGQLYPNYVVPDRIAYASSSDWTLLSKRVDRFSKPKGILKSKYLLIPLVPSTTLVVEANGQLRFDWISACNAIVSNTSDARLHSTDSTPQDISRDANSSPPPALDSSSSPPDLVNRSLTNTPSSQFVSCESGVNLSPLSRVMPSALAPQDSSKSSSSSSYRKKEDAHRRLVHLSCDQLLNANLTHVALSLTPTNSPVSIIAERYILSSRQKQFTIHSVFSMVMSSFFPSQVLNIPVSNESIYYNISLVGLEDIWQTYVLTVQTGSCYRSVKESGRVSSLVHLHVPWTDEDVFTVITSTKGAHSQMLVKINTAAPEGWSSLSPGSTASLAFYLEPECAYKIFVSFSITDAVSQLVACYLSSHLLPLMMALTIAVLAMQATLSASNCTSSSTLSSSVEPSNASFPLLPTVSHCKSLTCDPNDLREEKTQQNTTRARVTVNTGGNCNRRCETREEEQEKEKEKEQNEKVDENDEEEKKHIHETERKRKRKTRQENKEDEEEEKEQGEQGESFSSAETADANKIHQWIVFQESIERLLAMNLFPLWMLLLIPWSLFFTSSLVSSYLSGESETDLQGAGESSASSSIASLASPSPSPSSRQEVLHAAASSTDAQSSDREDTYSALYSNDTGEIMRFNQPPSKLQASSTLHTTASNIPSSFWPSSPLLALRQIVLSQFYNSSYTQSALVVCYFFLLSYACMFILAFLLSSLIKVVSLSCTSLEFKWRRMTGVRATSQVLPESHWSTGLNVKSFIICLCLLLLALATTSGLAYAAALILHLVQLIKLSITCTRLLRRTGVNQYSTCFHSHVTITFLLLFCNLATFPLTLHWIAIGCPLFFYSFASHSQLSTSDMRHTQSLASGNRDNGILDAVVAAAAAANTSSYFDCFSDGHIISCLLTLLCLSFVWQQKPLSFSLEPPHTQVSPPHPTASDSFAFSAPLTSSHTCCEKTRHHSSPSPSASSSSSSCRGNSLRRAIRNILLSSLNVTALFAATSCHNVFLLPHFSALAILLFTLNGMNSLLTDSPSDLQRITAHHHEHGE